MTAASALKVTGLTKVFSRKGQPYFKAVDGVSFDVLPGECMGLVGGSGSGKSTIANMVAGLLEPTSGSIALNGRDIVGFGGRRHRELAREVQMVFQNPTASFDPRRTLGDGIAESLRNFGTSKAEAHEHTRALLERCGLPESFENRYPREVSGGQCQRAAIARALAPGPSLIICDEATSALDVTVQAQIVDLLRDVRRDTGASLLFICHDLALVQGFCDRVAVMRQGRVVECGPTADVLANPRDSYTRQLLEAVLSV